MNYSPFSFLYFFLNITFIYFDTYYAIAYCELKLAIIVINLLKIIRENSNGCMDTYPQYFSSRPNHQKRSHKMVEKTSKLKPGTPIRDFVMKTSQQDIKLWSTVYYMVYLSSILIFSQNFLGSFSYNYACSTTWDFYNNYFLSLTCSIPSLYFIQACCSRNFSHPFKPPSKWLFAFP